MKLRLSSPLYFLLLICKPLMADELVTEQTFVNYLSNLSSFSASFSQKTYADQIERVVKGEIKANRKGMFKLTYNEPLNEVLLSDAINFYRYDPELEQLEIRPIENLINETFKDVGLEWYWDETGYKNLLKKSVGEKKIEDFLCWVIFLDSCTRVPIIRASNYILSSRTVLKGVCRV